MTQDSSTASSAAQGPAWLTNDKGIRRFGYIVTAVLVVVVVLWGGVAPLESAALAPGVVQVEGKRKAVQHLEGGIVAEILVENGDKVTQGQPLLVLDTTQTGAQLQVLEGRLYNFQAAVDRLIAERDNQQAIAFSPALLAAQDSDPRAAVAIAGEQAVFDARLTTRNGEQEVLTQRIHQLEQQVEGMQALMDSSQTVEASLTQEIADLQELLKEGYVDKQRLRELERSRSRVLGEVADTRSKIASARVAISETRLEILQLDKRFKTEVVDLLKDAQAQLYEVEQQYATAVDKVARSTVRAPAEGYVLGLQTTTVGAVISSGQELMQIVPSVDGFVVDARVSPMDIDRLRIGLPAEIRFAVFKDAYLVSGTLTNLSADRLVDEGTDMPYYAAEIEIEREDLALLGDVKIIPGMPADVLIKTGARTMLGYVTSPVNRVITHSLIED